jgi:predicted alpha/beta hydrolase family esterase
MSKRVIIVHGWQGSPNEPMIKNIGKDLKKEGFEIITPEMPETEFPRISPWIKKLEEVTGKVDEETYFIGHSIGCQTVLRFLENINNKIGGIVFIAPWIILNEKSLNEDEMLVAEPWLKSKINFQNINTLTNNFTCIFSDNDPFVPLINTSLFQRNLGAKIIIEKDKGHYATSDGVKDNKTVVEEIIRISGR